MLPLNLLMPHYCCSCGEIGTLFCENCKYNIVKTPYFGCVLCDNDKKTRRCHCPVSWCVGEYTSPLKQLLEKYKFQYARDAKRPLAELLSQRCARQLPANTIVTHVPTVRSHIRQRSYDHAFLLAREFARRNKLSHQEVFCRTSKTQQRGSSRKQRQVNANMAFAVLPPLEDRPYLIIDDIATTGATLRQLSILLREAGVREIYCAVIAKQPLD